MRELDLPSALSLEGLFTAQGYRFSMGLKRIAPETFFSNLHGSNGLGKAAAGKGRNETKFNDRLAERRAILVSHAGNHLCESPNPADAVAVGQFASTWIGPLGDKTFRSIGLIWEPDFVLLARGATGKVLGGCVCFPSGWSLPEKQDQWMAAVHGPVPGLNDSLGGKIDLFFKAMRQGDCYERTNWGLSSSSVLNQHPSQKIREIGPTFVPTSTWLRVEWQALIALDEGRLLFGIRIYHLCLAELKKRAKASEMLAENLRTMPEEMIRYKKLHNCRHELISFLDEQS